MPDLPDEPFAEGALPALVPLFPLPNVVLLPGAVLPLHIFEERYKQMTADALKGHRLIAMALLKAGWQKDYYGRPPIESVVCVGEILSHERLPDGRYNLLLRGRDRARLVRETRHQPYRLAELQVLPEVRVGEIELDTSRRLLAALFARDAYASLPGGKQIRAMLERGVPTPVVADLVAFHLLPEGDVALKHEILSEADVRRRVERTIEALAALRPPWQNVPDNVHLN